LSAAAVNAKVIDTGFEVVAENLTNLAFPLAAAELLIKRVTKKSQDDAELNGWRSKEVRIPRYRQQAVLARRL
jgi:hypothetical protein